ncbi:hypothetical protein CPJCM30710_01210 [Clostridium polyendosporum]|uniref:Uncharacterized protein n=1 Tax=Clostridium polyendosporum TaxID=69208 RepID=A0A919RVW9_9CLOT|nr:hypothetical protein [Clostridium polyendosporum]GIM27455.1 hypothetical protein CPJCM30710_01210 [Clostridium polyendosporum]
MELIIQQIINIDNCAESYRKDTKRLLNEKEKELEDEINELWMHWYSEKKVISTDTLKRMEEEGEEMAKKIRAEGEQKLSIIKNEFNNRKMIIVDEVVSRITKLNT